MTSVRLRVRATVNPPEIEDLTPDRRSWIIENAGKPVFGAISSKAIWRSI
jgi:hypothetical protein